MLLYNIKTFGRKIPCKLFSLYLLGEGSVKSILLSLCPLANVDNCH